MAKKITITVTRTDQYEIEINESVWNKQELEDWSKTFYPVNNVEDIATNLAVAWMRNGDKYFIEGFGYVKELDKQGQIKGIPYQKADGSLGYPLPDEKYAKGISIKAIDEDYNYETEIDSIVNS